MSCSNCVDAQTKYEQSIKDGQMLLLKLKKYQDDLDECKKWIKETSKRQMEASEFYEANFRQLLTDLDELVRYEDTKNGDGTEPRRNVLAEAIQLMSNNLLNVYKNLQIKDFEPKYEPTFTSLVQTLSPKLVSNLTSTSTDINNNNSSPLPTLSVKLNQTISQELYEYRQKTLMCKEKLVQQRKLIQSLLKKMSGMREPRVEDHSVSSETSTTSSCTSSSSSFQANSQQNNDSKLVETYQCPKCMIQIDSSKITIKKLESHIKKCDSSKLACIFCLKLYEQTEQVLYENHIQKHILKQTLERSSTTTTSNLADTSRDHNTSSQSAVAHVVTVANPQPPNNSI